MPWVGLSYILVVGGGYLWGFWKSRREAQVWQRMQGWRRAVKACGLSVLECTSRGTGRLQLVARLVTPAGPMKVRMNASLPMKSTRIVVVGPDPPDFLAVRIRRALRGPLPRVREIEVGDEPFDTEFFLEGPTRLVVALLDAETRRLLMNVNALCRLTIAGGEVRAETHDQHIPSLLPLLLELYRRFAAPLDVADRLSENARLDPEVGVRLRNLVLLARGFALDPRAAAALRIAVLDPSPEIRLKAAIELGAEGRGVLKELVEKAEGDACCAQAVAVLGRELPLESMNEILVPALRRRHVQTARACLEALGARGDPAVAMLAKVLEREHGELAAAAALALGATGSADAEPPLIRALEREPADLQVAAANALAAVGSAAAVLPLKDAAERFPRDPDLQRSTRQAIAAIHSRLSGASPGQLSLDDHEAGQLALAEVEAGQLSLATDAAGQLSLPTRKGQA